jgi:hypothetical protein
MTAAQMNEYSQKIVTKFSRSFYDEKSLFVRGKMSCYHYFLKWNHSFHGWYLKIFLGVFVNSRHDEQARQESWTNFERKNLRVFGK